MLRVDRRLHLACGRSQIPLAHGRTVRLGSARVQRIVRCGADVPPSVGNRVFDVFFERKPLRERFRRDPVGEYDLFAIREGDAVAQRETGDPRQRARARPSLAGGLHGSFACERGLALELDDHPRTVDAGRRDRLRLAVGVGGRAGHYDQRGNEQSVCEERPAQRIKRRTSFANGLHDAQRRCESRYLSRCSAITSFHEREDRITW